MEIKILTECNDAYMTKYINKQIELGWIPIYETFKVNIDGENEVYTIMMRRGY